MAAERTAEWLISVDDHVLEPGHVWQERIPSKYRDTAPRLVRDADGEAWIYEGKRMVTPGLGAVAGKSRRGVQLRAHHVRRDAARLLRLRRPAGGHEPRRGARFDVLSVLPALLRPGLQRGHGQGPRLALCAGLQRLDDRRVVRSCTRAVHPVDARPALGPASGRRRGPTNSREGLAGRLLLRKPGHARAPDGPRPERPLGSLHGRLRGDRHGRLHAHRLVEQAVHDVGRVADARHDVVVTPAHDRRGDDRMALQPRGAEVSRGSRSPSPREASVGSRSSSNGARRWSTSTATGSPAATSSTTRSRATSRSARTRASISKASRSSTRSVATSTAASSTTLTACSNLDAIGVDNVMIETDYPHSDSTWPNCLEHAKKQLVASPTSTAHKIMRGNAGAPVPLRTGATATKRSERDDR